jgi:rubredoxin
MPLVVGYDEAKQRPIGRHNRFAYFNFPDDPQLPHAILNGHEPGDYHLPSHFHVSDQFQVALDGSFKIGRHVLTPYCVHFSRAYTPYGPLVSLGPAFTFMVMRSHRDAGTKVMPDSRALLDAVPDRRPWQISQPVSFPVPAARPQSAEALWNEIPNLKNDEGLAGYTLIIKPDAKAKTPDASRSDGQYIVVVKGSFWHDGKEHKAIGLVFVKPEEGSYEIHAGSEGLEAIVLHYPEVKPRAAEVKSSPVTVGFKKWQCAPCGFQYDEAKGLPDEGIPAGTRWQDMPDSWKCPDCSADKSDFDTVET